MALKGPEGATDVQATQPGNVRADHHDRSRWHGGKGVVHPLAKVMTGLGNRRESAKTVPASFSRRGCDRNHGLERRREAPFALDLLKELDRVDVARNPYVVGPPSKVVGVSDSAVSSGCPNGA